MPAPSAGGHTPKLTALQNKPPLQKQRANQYNGVPTPVDVDRLQSYLDGFPAEKSTILVQGFWQGFKIPSSITSDPPKGVYTNHKSARENPTVVDKKLDKELQAGRIDGPFKCRPFKDLIISPLGLVPKKEPGQFRLIHDLSFPKDNSVNSHIDPALTTVGYELLDQCVEQVRFLGKGALIAKADIQDAFRILPIHPQDYRLLGFTWRDDFYFDKCLPMGCSISCATFEAFTQALQWVLQNKCGVRYMSHILDDFILFGPHASTECRNSLFAFTELAKSLNIPLKAEKTIPPSTRATLHGIDVDTINMSLHLPADKVQELEAKLSSMQHRKKVTLRQMQSLIGSLNFACRAVPGPGIYAAAH
jgi:hypothetical protein